MMSKAVKQNVIFYPMKDLFLRIGIVVFGFFLITPCFADKADSSFIRAYNNIVKRVPTDNAEVINASIDSLLNVADAKVEQAQILLFKAIMSIRAGKKVDALVFALQAENIALKAKSDEWQVRTAGFLSALYRNVGLVNEGIKHIDIADRANENLKDALNYDIIQINIIGERAYYESHNQNYDRAIELLHERESLIDDMPGAIGSEFLVGNYKLLGENYLELNDYNKARQMFEAALVLLDEQQVQSVEDISIYRGMGEVELHAGNYAAALTYLKRAENELSHNQDVDAQLMVYKSLSDYYYTVDMYDEGKHYNSLYLENFNERTRLTEAIFNQLIQRSDEIQMKNQNKMGFLIAFSAAAVILILVLLLRLRFVRKRDKAKYEALIQNLTNTSSLRSIDRPSGRTSMMSADTEERILNDLLNLEKELFFVDKDVSLTNLAKRLDTNTKYLSYVINTHKDKDFNNYINELRVLYIISKLRSNPEYLNYKLAYIADEAGFSSHSKFTAVFKSVTDLSPSAFISHLKNERS